MQRPSPSEVVPYFHPYLDAVPDGDVVELLRRQRHCTHRALAELTEGQGEHRYAEGKWSVKELVGHLADSERVFAYRALSFARRDGGALPGMDQDQWMAAAGFATRSIRSVVDEFGAVRDGSVALFAGLPSTVQHEVGEASGSRFSVRTFPWLIAGHERHHLGVLAERYGIEVPLA